MDVFINQPDKLAWVYDDIGSQWVEYPMAPTVTTSATTGETPTAPQMTTMPTLAREGDTFLNTVDQLAWQYDGTTWQKISSPPPVVTLDAVAGNEPATGTFPAGYTPHESDTYVNTTDQKSWIYDEDSAAWTPTGSTPTVTTDTNPGNTPLTNPPANPNTGDIFVNEPDQIGWVYDANTAGTASTGWEPLSKATHVTVADQAGRDPYNTAPPVVNVGDWFVNETDGQAWVYADGGGTATPPERWGGSRSSPTPATST